MLTHFPSPAFKISLNLRLSLNCTDETNSQRHAELQFIANNLTHQRKNALDFKYFVSDLVPCTPPILYLIHSDML